MYAWLWKHLPGDLLTRLCTAAGIMVVAGLVLWYLVFPWVEPKLRFDHGTVGGSSAPANPSPP
jgi:hypothetical protein